MKQPYKCYRCDLTKWRAPKKHTPRCPECRDRDADKQTAEHVMTNDELEAALRLAAEAERVAAKATGGPWFQWTAGGDVSSSPEDCIIMQTMWTRKTRESYTRATKQGNWDCAFVVHARNHMPEFIELVRGLVERVRKLEMAARLLEKRRAFMLPGTFDQAVAELAESTNA